ncbi:MAG TPA: hypothetical protein VFS21_11360, partial [Roseiflexaceae bacterium]|nr:hypothetical protein [Roseiflexaceae bacterium]
FDALARLGGGRPWLAKLTLRDAEGRRFLERRGFRVAVRTLTGLLDPARPETRAWLAGLTPAPPDLRLERLEQPGTAQLAALAEAHAAVYRWTHAWNPPADQGPETLLARFCGPQVLPGSQIGAWRGERLVGAANLIADPLDPQPGAAYLVWIGPVDPLTPDAPAITAALLRAAREYAAAQGLALRFEADDSHNHLHALLDTAPSEEVDRDVVVMMQDGEQRL